MKTAIAVTLGIQSVSVAGTGCFPSIGIPLSITLSVLSILILLTALYKEKYGHGVVEIETIIEEKVAERTTSLVEKMNLFEEQATTDALTSLLNRRGGERAISHHIARCRRLGTSFSLLLVDIDLFKYVNDNFGHSVGDDVISGVSSIIKKNLRTADFAIRWGGEEYLVCLPDTNLTGALLVAEKLRKAVEKSEFSGITATVSIGCAELGDSEFEVAFASADMSLYLAKSKGRNQVFPSAAHRRLDSTG